MTSFFTRTLQSKTQKSVLNLEGPQSVAAKEFSVSEDKQLIAGEDNNPIDIGKRAMCAQDTCGNNDDADVTEIKQVSYEELLQSTTQEIVSNATDKASDMEKKSNDVYNPSSMDTVAEVKTLASNELDHKPKAVQSILSFFPKSDPSTKPPANMQNCSENVKKIVVKADVHKESSPGPRMQKTDRSFDIFNRCSRGTESEVKSPDCTFRARSPQSNVSISKEDFDDSIVVIDSEDNGSCNKKLSDSKTTDVSTKLIGDEKRGAAAEKLKALGGVPVKKGKKNVQSTLPFGSNSGKPSKKRPRKGHYDS